MIEASTPADESQRLRALYDFDILDTDPETEFDELTEMVALMLDVPMALVSLVDESRQWFKSRRGLDASETPREYAFCAHAIHSDAVFTVPDSHEDERFVDNPLVTDGPKIRFYVGAPLVTSDGHRLGTLCGLSDTPRELTSREERFMQIAAHQVIAQLERRRSVRRNRDLFVGQNEALRQLEFINQEVLDLVAVVTHDLQAPAQNIAGFADELQQSTQRIATLLRTHSTRLPEDLKEQLDDEANREVAGAVDYIRRSVAQMNDRIAAIKRLSHKGRYVPTLGPVDLRAVFAAVVDTHDVELRKIGGSVEIGELPEIVADKTALQLVAENFISNAIKYRAADRDLRIRVYAESAEQGTYLRVEDNGRGIAPEHIEKVFVMFQRVGTQDQPGDGTGLAHCRAILHRQGGRVGAESEPGKGSTFYAFLPRKPLLGESRPEPRAAVRSSDPVPV